MKFLLLILSIAVVVPMSAQDTVVHDGVKVTAKRIAVLNNDGSTKLVLSFENKNLQYREILGFLDAGKELIRLRKSGEIGKDEKLIYPYRVIMNIQKMGGEIISYEADFPASFILTPDETGSVIVRFPDVVVNKSEKVFIQFKNPSKSPEVSIESIEKNKIRLDAIPKLQIAP